MLGAAADDPCDLVWFTVADGCDHKLAMNQVLKRARPNPLVVLLARIKENQKMMAMSNQKEQAVRLGITSAIQPGAITAPRGKLQIGERNQLDVQLRWSQLLSL